MARGYSQMTPAALCREQANTMGNAVFTQVGPPPSGAGTLRQVHVRDGEGTALRRRCPAHRRDLSNAVTDCKAERAESASAFRSRYATRRGELAFARCVASKADSARPFLALKVNARKFSRP